MIQIYPIRLNPGQDLKVEISRFCQSLNLTAATIISGVGSLTHASLRFAAANVGSEIQGPLEIVSITGTIAQNGIHLHISVSDKNGHVFGGHLLEGNIIRTTAEIIVMSFNNYLFNRELDSITGYHELKINPLPQK